MAFGMKPKDEEDRDVVVVLCIQARNIQEALNIVNEGIPGVRVTNTYEVKDD